uniref:Outer membrane protein assembly factor BamA n=1 Tax=uncultured Acidobacteriota bacterium TaxID=171953 RepID=H5SDC4_9BACT|nr:surface antigen [uncultured Acidobacteriota bacterium]
MRRVVITVLAAWSLVLASGPSLLARSQVTVEDVLIRGNRRLTADSIRYYIQTRRGDPYNPAQIERDIQALWAQNLFRNIRVYVQDGPEGGKIVTFEVEENPIIRDLKFVGLKSVQESDVLQRFRERRVGVSKEAMWDPAKGQVARRVLKDLLAEKGKPEATVDIEVEELSTAAVAVTFKVNEGPRVRVVKIEFEGNQVFSDKKLRKAMKEVRQAGFLTRFTSRDIYHPEALKRSLERVRFFVLADNGYIDAQIGEPKVEMIQQGGGIPLPLFRKPKRGLKITIPINEGKQYRFGKIEVEGNTLYTDEQILRIIGLKTGDVVRSTVIQKGVFETLKDLYGANGYIQMSANPRHELRDDPNDPKKGIADFTIEIEEGRQFVLNRLEFTGNTNTRDKVLRREMLVAEGEVFNQYLWKQSLLRLNQLGYFEEIKEEHATFRTNDREGLLDIELNVKEKGRNQIQFTGGASGIGGSYIGIDYSTNNLFGYGESLTFSLAQGNLVRYFLFSFTEPYVLDRNVSLGFSIFARSYDFFGGGLGILSGGFLSPGLFGLRGESLFKDKTAGFSVFMSTPLATLTKRWWRLGQFSRVGLSYSYSANSIEDPPVNRDADPNNDIPVTFRQPNIRTSMLVPSFTYNTLNHPIDPTSGTSFFLSLGISGGFLGGNVRLIQPTVEFKYFRPTGIKFLGKDTVIGMRVLASHITNYGAPFDSNSLAFVGGIPIFSRFFLGGEDSIRGFGIRSVAPVVPVRQRFTSKNVEAIFADDPDPFKTTRTLPVVPDAAPAPAQRPFIRQSVLEKFVFTDELLTRTLVPVGGDTQLLYNFEYRIPLAGPLSVAAFFDIGSAFNLKGYRDQQIVGTPLPQFISPLFVASRRVIPLGHPLLTELASFEQILLNPNGFLATPEEVRIAQRAQGKLPTEVPDGFTQVKIRGLGSTRSEILLSEGVRGLRGLRDYRASLGIEFRFQMPVINIPFRFIWAYNPNAKTTPGPNQIFFEEKSVFRFSIGRTF